MRSYGWDPTWIRLASLLEEEEILEISLSLPSCKHRKEVMWGHRKKVGIFNSRRESFHQTPTLLAPWSYTSSLQNCEERILCCLSHPACGVLSWQPKLTNTQVESVSAGHLHCGYVAVSWKYTWSSEKSCCCGNHLITGIWKWMRKIIQREKEHRKERGEPGWNKEVGTASMTEWFTEEHRAMTWKEFQKSKSELQQKWGRFQSQTSWLTVPSAQEIHVRRGSRQGCWTFYWGVRANLGKGNLVGFWKASLRWVAVATVMHHPDLPSMKDLLLSCWEDYLQSPQQPLQRWLQLQRDPLPRGHTSFHGSIYPITDLCGSVTFPSHLGLTQGSSEEWSPSGEPCEVGWATTEPALWPFSRERSASSSCFPSLLPLPPSHRC